jgi:hypothetical protein
LLAKAEVATAQGDHDAGILSTKLKDIISSPKMLEMMRIENEILAEEFELMVNLFGNNNIFGSNAAQVVKDLI